MYWGNATIVFCQSYLIAFEVCKPVNHICSNSHGGLKYFDFLKKNTQLFVGPNKKENIANNNEQETNNNKHKVNNNKTTWKTADGTKYKT